MEMDTGLQVHGVSTSPEAAMSARRRPEVLNDLNRLIARVARRAERNGPEILARTFVEVDKISCDLQGVDHQVLYGRRGTGKTHALNHFSTQLKSQGELAIYIDLRRIGSNGGLYSDSASDLSLRASQLLIDVIEAVHNSLFDAAADNDAHSGVLNYLDDLGEAATKVRVEGPLQQLVEVENESNDGHQRMLEAGIRSTTGVSTSVNRGNSRQQKSRKKRSVSRMGNELPRLLFGELGRCMDNVANAVAPGRIWMLLDEWSSLPTDLQPILADMLKRTFFTCPRLTVKIASVERRSSFVTRESQSRYIGIELGADTTAALNLDDHLIGFSDGSSKASEFFSELIYRHLSALYEDLGRIVQFPIATPGELIELLFDRSAFGEFVMAAEGVPRDAINILGLSASIAGSAQISSADVRRAARQYYLQDKEKGITGNRRAEYVWQKLQRDVIVSNRKRTFLLKRVKEQTYDAMLDLYDARLIHLLRPGLTSHSRPGASYDGYSIDYGAYVNILKEAELAAMWRASRHQPTHAERSLPPSNPVSHFDDELVFTPPRQRSTIAPSQHVTPPQQ
ncbi:MAG: ATP-binding protein [Actinomycetota bacterium]|nr:ATP-binding protein [Actinomycetota bacterium]